MLFAQHIVVYFGNYLAIVISYAFQNSKKS